MEPLFQALGVGVTLGGVPVLQNVSLSLGMGELGLVVGRSGCGKSVLLKSLVGFLPLAGGEVRLAGRRVDPVREAGVLRRRVVLVHQDSTLLDNQSVLDNVALPVSWRGDARRGEAEARARAALERVGAGAWMGARAGGLPAGTRKLVAVARALAVQPQVLLLDEPTTGLDVPSAGRVGEVCGEIARGGTALLVVTHDTEPFRACARRVWVLSAGTVVEEQEAPDAWLSPLPTLAQLTSGAAEGPLGTPET
jgi:ABC-type multidrug transport system ATPase subunit